MREFDLTNELIRMPSTSPIKLRLGDYFLNGTTASRLLSAMKG